MPVLAVTDKHFCSASLEANPIISQNCIWLQVSGHPSKSILTGAVLPGLTQEASPGLVRH